MPLPKISLDNVSSAYFRGGRGQIRTPRANGRPVSLDHAWSDKAHFLACPSYFARDYFDRLFG